MCGRYTLTVTLEELMLRYLTDRPATGYHTPRYNIAPMQQVMAVIHDGKKNRLGQLQWGLIPSWAKDDKGASKMINARAETLMTRPSFKKLIYRKRCIIPADGFYEWKRKAGEKQPMRIVLKNREIFSLAALYDTWVNPAGKKISTCTIITTKPNALMADIHHRMPVILAKKDESAWLDRTNQNIEQLLSLLQPFPDTEMTAYPVSPIVGNVKNDSEACIQEVKADR